MRFFDNLSVKLNKNNTKKIYKVTLLDVDSKFYVKYCDSLRSSNLDVPKRDYCMLDNLLLSKTRRLCDILVYYSHGGFKELLTGVSIPCVEEVHTFYLGMNDVSIKYKFIGQEFPVFFTCCVSNSLINYSRFVDLNNMVASNYDIQQYKKEHYNANKYRIELKKIFVQGDLNYSEMLMNVDYSDDYSFKKIKK